MGARSRKKPAVLVVINSAHAFPRMTSFINVLKNEFQFIVLDYRMVGQRQGLFLDKDIDVRLVQGGVDPKSALFSVVRRVLKPRADSESSEETSCLNKAGHHSNFRTLTGIFSRLAVVLNRIFYSFFLWPDSHMRAVKKLRAAGSEIIANNDIELIITSSPYNSVNCVGQYLAKRSGIKWVADLRDGWSTNHFYPGLGLRQRVDRYVEKHYLSWADRIVTVDESVAKDLAGLHQKTSVSVVPNGYMSAGDLSSQELGVTEGPLRILYTGALYYPEQDPTLLFDALGNLVKKGLCGENDVEVAFVGSSGASINRTFQLNDFEIPVIDYGIREWDFVQQLQASSDVLLVFGWSNPKVSEIYPLKFYEYLPWSRPILVVGGGKSNAGLERILTDVGGGSVCTSVEAVENEVVRLLSEKRTAVNRQSVRNLRKVRKYSLASRAQEFRQVMDETINERH